MVSDMPINLSLSKERLESSHRLTGAEMRLATEFIVAAEAQVQDVDSGISHSQSTEDLGALSQKRAALLERIVQHKDALRAVRRLPPEIISDCLASTVSDVALDAFPDTPWYLGHICQYWREVALGVSTLWSDIVIYDTARFTVEKLEIQFSRSGNSPLKVLLWSTRLGDPRTAALLQMLVDCAPRWLAASIFINPANFFQLAKLRGRIPMLRYLRINVVDYARNSRSTVQSDPFEIAPELREVSFEDLSGLKHPIVLPFHQLICVKAVAPQRALTALLSRSRSLEVASLDFVGDPSPALMATTPLIHLPALRRLYISWSMFLDALELPALEELYMIDSPPAALLSLLSRCPTAKLKILMVHWCTPANIAAILSACSTLETLGVQIASGDKPADLLRGLTVGATSVCLGPNLCSIAFSVDGGNIDQGMFVAMVESRWRVPAHGGPCCRLRVVELLIADRESLTLDTVVVQRLEALKREGLQVVLLRGEAATNRSLDQWRI